MKRVKSLIIFTLLFLPILVCSQSKTNEVVIKTEIDSLSYAMGVYNASTMKQADIKDINFNAFAKGFQDEFKGEGGVMSKEEAMNFLNHFFSNQQQRIAEENLMVGRKFLEENAKKEGIVVDPSGLQYKVLKQGDGPKPISTDVVKVHYHGTKIDGSVFDSSVERNDPAEFPLNRVIKGWTLGLTFMNVGSKYIFYIPSEMAYGPSPRQGGPIKPNEVLIFEVELLGISKPNE